MACREPVGRANLSILQAEAVRENLKNVVLFMATSGYLVSPDKDPSRKKLWDETWERVNRFLPDLRNEILGEEAPEPIEAKDGGEEKQ